MKQLAHANPSVQQPAPEPGKRAWNPLVAKAAGCLAAAGLLFSGCMAPRYNVFRPVAAHTAQEPVLLTEDIYRAFERAVCTSTNYRVEISGRDGAFGPFSYRATRREGEDWFYRFARSIASGKRERSPEVQIGPSSQSFMLPIEPTGNFGSSVIVVTYNNLVSISFLNPQGSWEEISTSVRDSASGLRFEVLYSQRGNKLIVLASPADLEDGMPGFISALAVDLGTGRLELRDYLPAAK